MEKRETVTNNELVGLAADLNALTEAPTTRKGPPCSVGAVLATVDEETAAVLRRILDNGTISSTGIADVLSQHGRTVTGYTVARHRRRGNANGCRCPRDPGAHPRQRVGLTPRSGEASSPGLLVLSIGPDGWDHLRLL